MPGEVGLHQVFRDKLDFAGLAPEPGDEIPDCRTQTIRVDKVHVRHAVPCFYLFVFTAGALFARKACERKHTTAAVWRRSP